MYRKIIWTLLFVATINLIGKSQNISPKASISVLTCGPGEELFVSFGHTALRICDTANQWDYVFNYGIFDFSTDYFYFKFAKGRLNYMLAIQPYEGFIAEYAGEGRFVWEQKLDLTTAEKQKMFDFLIENYKPENRYYKYDFFQDNCATRVRDLIAFSLIDRTFPRKDDVKNHLSFREKFHHYTHNYPWWTLGIDIVLGLPADKKASDWDYMFLPVDLMDQFDTTQIGQGGKTLISEKTQILEQTRVQSSPPVVHPLWVFGLLFVLACLLSLWERKKGFYCKAFDVFLFSTVFLVSIAVFFMCFLSDHSATKFNLNLLWVNPFIIIPLIRLRKTPNWVIAFLVFCLMAAFIHHLIFLNVMGVIPILLILTICVRLILLLKKTDVVAKGDS